MYSMVVTVRRSEFSASNHFFEGEVIIFTGHSHLSRHLFKMGLMDSPIGERSLEKDELAKHIL
jgi:hypothetical protein